MINYSTGQVVTDADLNLIKTNDGYLDFVSDGQANDFMSNVFLDDQHLLYETVERLEKKTSDILCFRMLKKKR